MTEIEDFDEQLQAQLNKFDKMIQDIPNLDFKQKQSQYLKVQQIQKNINTLIESCDMEINNLDRNQAEKYQQQLFSHQKRFQLLKGKFNELKNEGQTNKELFGNAKNIANLDIQEMNQQQVMEYGDHLQEKGLSKLDNIIIRIDEGQALANEINIEMDRQIQVLDRAHSKLKDTQVVLKRTQALLNYFARQIQTDKLLMCCICLIIIAILVIIILSAMGKTGIAKSII